MKALTLRKIKIGKNTVRPNEVITGSPSFIRLMQGVGGVRPLEPYPVEKTLKEKVEAITDEQIAEIAIEVPDSISEDKYSGYTIKKARSTLKRRGVEHRAGATKAELLALLRK